MIEIRKALISDIDDIVHLRMNMLHEVAKTVPCGLENNIRKYLEAHIADGSCLCTLMTIDGVIIAKAMLCCCDVMPDEKNVCGKAAALFSVYTLPEYRGNGYMSDILTQLFQYARNCGVGVIHASAEEKAVPLYERLGFRAADNEMLLDLYQ